MRKVFCFGTALFPVLMLATFTRAEIIGKLQIDLAEAQKLVPSEVSEWRIQVIDANSQEQLKKFKEMHGRKMHLLVMKDDLSTFAHLHPTLIGKTGTFSMVVNQKSYDPENEMATKVITEPGRYYVFAEVFPDRGAKVPKSEFARITVQAEGEAVSKPAEADPSDHHGGIVKYFEVDGLRPIPTEVPGREIVKELKITPGAFGATYETKLHVMTIPGCGGNLVQFHFEMAEWVSKKGIYVPVTDFEDWMMMTGHAALINVDGKSIEDKQIAHLHGMAHEGMTHVVFNQFDRKQMNGRRYKLWVQVKHHKHILTFPFTFDYQANYRDEGCGK